MSSNGSGLRDLRLLGFEWDLGNSSKCEKHGVSRAEIESLFQSRSIVVRPDRNHSQVEARYHAIGRSAHDRYIFVAFTVRGDSDNARIRAVSARYMHAKEVARYEQAFSSFQK